MIDYANPVDNLSAFMKLQFSLDAAELAYYYEGPVYGCLEDGSLQPLFSYHSLLRYSVTPLGKDTWQTTYRDAGYYGDLDSGAPLTHFKNPYNGRTVEPLAFVEGPGISSTSPTEAIWGSGSHAAVTKRIFHSPFRIMGDTVWMEYDIVAALPNPLSPARWPLASTGTTLPISSITLFRGSRAALEDPAVRSVPDTQFFDHSILPWMPWMLMGDRPGSLLYSGSGKKIVSFSEIPDARLAVLKRLHPEHFLPAREWGTEFQNPWTQFAHRRQPQ